MSCWFHNFSGWVYSGGDKLNGKKREGQGHEGDRAGENMVRGQVWSKAEVNPASQSRSRQSRDCCTGEKGVKWGATRVTWVQNYAEENPSPTHTHMNSL